MVNPSLFDFVVVNEEEEDGAESSESQSPEAAAAASEAAVAAPIDSLVSERLRSAAASAAATHPFKSFLMKRGAEGKVFLIGVGRHDKV